MTDRFLVKFDLFNLPDLLQIRQFLRPPQLIVMFLLLSLLRLPFLDFQPPLLLSIRRTLTQCTQKPSK
jgi:hypothetical protein